MSESFKPRTKHSEVVELKKARFKELKGLTQAALGRVLGITPDYVNNHRKWKTESGYYPSV